ncbi:FGGY family carbohydrate kinase [Thalassotalea crassostreae]|uniref:FGGY family carbohydrate kinase n=1 Tax=Thalassotalea crassostreae TaxID=1763536 RepID=UPI0008384BBD|nr:FGGY family carbohydrate kinase [Thalassotalea crassostreae]
MKKQHYLLAIDFGTQSLRGVIFDPDGKVVAIEVVKNSVENNQKINAVKRSHQWYLEQLDALFIKLNQSNVDITKVKAISFTVIRNTLLLLDNNMESIGYALPWGSGFNAVKLPRLKWYWRLAFSLGDLFVKITPSLQEMQKRAAINTVWASSLNDWQRINKVALLSSFLHMSITGKLIDSTASTIAYLPFDYKKGRWYQPWHWKFQALAIKSSWLYPLVEPGTNIGTLSSNALQSTKLAENVSVIASGSDKACELLGSGCINHGDVHISLGTAISVSQLNRKFIGPKRFYPAYPSLTEGLFITEQAIDNGMSQISTFINRNKNDIEALFGNNDEGKLSIETQFDRILQDVNEASVEPSIEPSIVSSYNALLDDIVEEIEQCLSQVFERTKLAKTRIYVSGGGAQSPILLQKIATKCQVQLVKPKCTEASALGAAVCMAVSEGIYSSQSEAIDNMVEIEQMISP